MTKSAALTFPQFQTREGMEWAIVDADNNIPATLVGAAVTLRIFNNNIIIVNDRDISSGIVAPATGGVVQYYPQTGDMDTAGDFNTELRIVFGDGSTGYIRNKPIIIYKVSVGT